MERKLLKYFKNLSQKGNELKDIIQQYAVDKWVDEGCMGYMCFYTGFGKTNTALLASTRYFKVYDGLINVIVPTSKLYKQWNKKIDSKQLRQENKQIDVNVLNSYTMNFATLSINRTPDIFIADELHRMCNDQSKYFSKALAITKFNMFLGLSATLEQRHKDFLATYNITECFEITLEEGLELGLVPEFDIYNLGCELTEKEEEVYDYWNGLYLRKLKYFSALTSERATDLATACTKDEGYSIVSIDGKRVKKKNSDWIDYVANYYNITRNDVKEAANIWRNAMTSRNKCLQEVNSKFETASIILNDLFKNKKAIAFVETIDQANNLALVTEGFSIHSKVKEKLKESLLDVFETDEFNEIVDYPVNQIITVKALDEGYDSEELECAIAKHFTSVPRQFLQRLG